MFLCSLGQSHCTKVTDSITTTACVPTVMCPALRQQTPTCSLNSMLVWKTLSAKCQECKQRVYSQSRLQTRSQLQKEDSFFHNLSSVKQMMSPLSLTLFSGKKKLNLCTLFFITKNSWLKEILQELSGLDFCLTILQWSNNYKQRSKAILNSRVT